MSKTKYIRECEMCGEKFQQKNKTHFKCPKCGAHFTKQIEVIHPNGRREKITIPK